MATSPAEENRGLEQGCGIRESFTSTSNRAKQKGLRDAMELWATGFNAWSQLQFDGELHTAQPRDLQSFESVLKDEEIEVLRASLSATLGMFLVFLCGIKVVQFLAILISHSAFLISAFSANSTFCVGLISRVPLFSPLLPTILNRDASTHGLENGAKR